MARLPLYKGFLFGLPITVLFDTGSSGLFLAEEFQRKHNLPVRSLGTPLDVKLADGSILRTDLALKYPAPVKIGSYRDKLPLRVVPLDSGFDVVLGMPWIAEVKPVIDWDSLEATISLPGQPTSVLKPMLSEIPVTASIMSVRAFKRHIKRFGTDDVIAVYESLNSMTDQDPRVAAILTEYKDVFAAPTGLPPLRGGELSIDLEPGAKPPYRKPYRLSQSEQDELKRQLTQLLEQGLIRPSSSPFGAPVFFVRKKDGSLRPVLDYRELNKVTIKDKYSPPRAEDLFNCLHRAKHFSALDLTAAYNQIRINPEHVPRTAITTPFGNFEYLVGSFGLCNMPACFQRNLDKILFPYIRKFCLVYLDDILIFSETEEEHEQHVRAVLDILRQHQFYAKASKCKFFLREVEYLGHVVGADGIRIAEERLAVVKDWPVPTNLKEVRSFIGLANYFRRFIRQFAEIAHPLYALTKNGAPFKWGEEQLAAFIGLRDALTTAPVVVAPDPTLPYMVFTDASDHAGGAVLCQDHGSGPQVIAYESFAWNNSQLNYAVHDKELYALMHVVTHKKKWRNLLYDMPFTCYTDNLSVSYLESLQPGDLSAKWWAKLMRFSQIKVEHIPGKTNVVADALSRRPSPAVLAAISSVSVSASWLSALKQGYEQDTKAAALFAELASINTFGPFLYSQANGLLYYKGRLYVPNVPALRAQLLSEHHDTPLAGHQGVERTTKLLKRYYYWPGMDEDVRAFVQTCPVCQRAKGSNQKPLGLLQPLPIPERKWQSISMDFVVQLPRTSEGYDAIMTVLCRFSKRVHFIPMNTDATAKEVAKLYFREIWKHHGLSESIVSDRDPKFTSKFWQALFKLLGSKLDMSTAFHPESDGQTERYNRILGDMLRAYCSERQSHWVDVLPAIEFACNNHTQSSTGYSPFFLEYFQHPLTPAALLHPTKPSLNPAADEFVEQYKTVLADVKLHIKAAQKRQKRYADESRQETPSFAPDDEVMMSTLHRVRLGPDRKRKLTEKWQGPYRIIEMVGPNAAKLELPAGSRGHNVINVSQLKQAHKSNPDKFPNRKDVSKPKPLFYSDGVPTFEVERLLAKGKYNKTWFVKIKWLGYDDEDENTWQPKRDVLSYPNFKAVFADLPWEPVVFRSTDPDQDQDQESTTQSKQTRTARRGARVASGATA